MISILLKSYCHRNPSRLKFWENRVVLNIKCSSRTWDHRSSDTTCTRLKTQRCRECPCDPGMSSVQKGTVEHFSKRRVSKCMPFKKWMWECRGPAQRNKNRPTRSRSVGLLVRSSTLRPGPPPEVARSSLPAHCRPLTVPGSGPPLLWALPGFVPVRVLPSLVVQGPAWLRSFWNYGACFAVLPRSFFSWFFGMCLALLASDVVGLSFDLLWLLCGCLWPWPFLNCMLLRCFWCRCGAAVSQSCLREPVGMPNPNGDDRM